MCSSRRRSSVAASGEGAGSGWWVAVGGGLSSRPAVTPPPEGLSLPAPRGPTPYQSCPNKFYRLPSAVLTVLPLLRRQNLAMGGSPRKLVAETLGRPWRRPPRGGTGRDPGGAGHRMLGVRGGERRCGVVVSGAVVSSPCLVCVSEVTAERPPFGRSSWVRSCMLPEHRTRTLWLKKIHHQEKPGLFVKRTRSPGCSGARL